MLQAIVQNHQALSNFESGKNKRQTRSELRSLSKGVSSIWPSVCIHPFRLACAH